MFNLRVSFFFGLLCLEIWSGHIRIFTRPIRLPASLPLQQVSYGVWVGNPHSHPTDKLLTMMKETSCRLSSTSQLAAKLHLSFSGCNTTPYFHLPIRPASHYRFSIHQWWHIWIGSGVGRLLSAIADCIIARIHGKNSRKSTHTQMVVNQAALVITNLETESDRDVCARQRRWRRSRCWDAM